MWRIVYLELSGPLVLGWFCCRWQWRVAESIPVTLTDFRCGFSLRYWARHIHLGYEIVARTWHRELTQVSISRDYFGFFCVCSGKSWTKWMCNVYFMEQESLPAFQHFLFSPNASFWKWNAAKQWMFSALLSSSPAAAGRQANEDICKLNSFHFCRLWVRLSDCLDMVTLLEDMAGKCSTTSTTSVWLPKSMLMR